MAVTAKRAWRNSRVAFTRFWNSYIPRIEVNLHPVNSWSSPGVFAGRKGTKITLRLWCGRPHIGVARIVMQRQFITRLKFRTMWD